MGDDFYTLGKPHPMIDGTQRRRRILNEARDPSVAVLLLDFILGYNASPDPVGDLLDAIIEAKKLVLERGGLFNRGGFDLRNGRGSPGSEPAIQNAPNCRCCSLSEQRSRF